MTSFKRTSTILLAGCALSALSGCGPNDIASPGEGSIVVVTPTPSTTPTPSPTPTPGTGLVTPASDCPTIAGPDQLTKQSTISGPTGEYLICAFPARFTASTQIPKQAGVVYALNGRVDVGTDKGAGSSGYDVTLGIDPGVVIFGATGQSYLAVNRGNQINAVGTLAQPIIFTGRLNITGAATDDTQELWGGVVLLGRAPVTDCAAAGAAEGTVACERDTEGTSNALYGGASPTDNSGKLQYVQIRYSGFKLANDIELQGLTPEGVGSATTIDHIQVHNSSDDGIEVFGGRVNMKYLVITGADDDSLDTDVGYKGFVQFLLAIQRPNLKDGVAGSSGDAMLEVDSNGNENAVPRQFVRLSNFTFIHRGSVGGDAAGMMFRGGADYALMNGIHVEQGGLPCIRINSTTTTQAADPAKDEKGPPTFNSVVLTGCSTTPFTGSGGVATSDVLAIFNAGTHNNVNYTPTLTDGFINGATETGVTPYDPTTLNDSTNFLVKKDYIGAVKDASDTWYQGWTCKAAYYTFGGTGGLCTSLPTS